MIRNDRSTAPRPRAGGAVPVMGLLLFSGCSPSDLTLEQAEEQLAHHLNDEVFEYLTINDRDVEFHVTGDDLLHAGEGQREFQGEVRVQYTEGDTTEVPVESDFIPGAYVGPTVDGTVQFALGEESWRIRNYGRPVTELVAWYVRRQLQNQYAQVIEWASRIEGAYRDYDLSLLTARAAAIDEGRLEDADALQREQARLPTRDALHQVIEGMDPRLPDWLEWEAVVGEPGSADIIEIRGKPPELDEEIVCVQALGRDDNPPPVGYTWAADWGSRGTACTGGNDVWIGMGPTREKIIEEIEERGYWVGW